MEERKAFLLFLPSSLFVLHSWYFYVSESEVAEAVWVWASRVWAVLSLLRGSGSSTAGKGGGEAGVEASPA